MAQWTQASPGTPSGRSSSFSETSSKDSLGSREPRGLGGVMRKPSSPSRTEMWPKAVTRPAAARAWAAAITSSRKLVRPSARRGDRSLGHVGKMALDAVQEDRPARAVLAGSPLDLYAVVGQDGGRPHHLVRRVDEVGDVVQKRAVLVFVALYRYLVGEVGAGEPGGEPVAVRVLRVVAVVDAELPGQPLLLRARVVGQEVHVVEASGSDPPGSVLLWVARKLGDEAIYTVGRVQLALPIQLERHTTRS